MHLLADNRFKSPAHHLAADEALLNLLEMGECDEVLRFWESPSYFVVLGSSNKVKEEVNEEACMRDGVPVLRRHSGGGTVLQGPGCLNYSLVLRIDPEGPTRNITDTTRHVMLRHAEVLSELIGERVEMRGSSDLTVGAMKISGNAQRRRMKALLFHGTFLLQFHIPSIETYLKQPPKQPEYRKKRPHADFVRNIGVSPTAIQRVLADAWNATATMRETPHALIEELVVTKYGLASWNLKH